MLGRQEAALRVGSPGSDLLGPQACGASPARAPELFLN